MNNLPRILLVDESPSDRKLVELVLVGEFGEIDLEAVGSAAEFSRALAAGRFGLVITEVRLSWGDGVELVKLVREVRPECPLIFFTSQAGEPLWRETLRLQIDDLVLKNSDGFVQLPGAVRSALFRARRRALASSADAPYRRFVEALPVGVFVATLDGEIIEANPALATMLGLADAEQVARSRFPGFFVQESAAETWRSQINTARGIGSFDAQLRRADGVLMWARISSWIAEDAATSVRNIQGIVEETGEYHIAQEKLASRTRALARSNAELEQFAYVVSHDLQQPLSLVTSYLDLLVEGHTEALDEEARSFVERAAAGAQRMQQMVDAVLGYSRVDSRGREFIPVNLDRVVDQVIGVLRGEIELSAASITRAELPTVIADPAQMEQLLQNLIANALKFSGDRPPKISLEAEEREHDWVLAVRDEGIGIDPSAVDRIFTMFQRLHTEEDVPGTGIGLAICKRIVERHGGRIWVESQPRHGATFKFTMPKRNSQEGEGEG